MIKATLHSQPQHVAFIDACHRHCQPDAFAGGCLWNHIAVSNVTQDAALTAFLRPQAPPPEVLASGGSGRHLWEQTASYPCKQCCLGNP